MLSNCLDRLEAVKDRLQAFADDGGRAEFFLGWYFFQNSGATLERELLARMADFQIDLALDIYPERNEIIPNPHTEEA